MKAVLLLVPLLLFTVVLAHETGEEHAEPASIFDNPVLLLGYAVIFLIGVALIGLLVFPRFFRIVEKA